MAQGNPYFVPEPGDNVRLLDTNPKDWKAGIKKVQDKEIAESRLRRDYAEQLNEQMGPEGHLLEHQRKVIQALSDYDSRRLYTIPVPDKTIEQVVPNTDVGEALIEDLINPATFHPRNHPKAYKRVDVVDGKDASTMDDETLAKGSPGGHLYLRCTHEEISIDVLRQHTKDFPGTSFPFVRIIAQWEDKGVTSGHVTYRGITHAATPEIRRDRDESANKCTGLANFLNDRKVFPSSAANQRPKLDVYELQVKDTCSEAANWPQDLVSQGMERVLITVGRGNAANSAAGGYHNLPQISAADKKVIDALLQATFNIADEIRLPPESPEDVKRINELSCSLLQKGIGWYRKVATGLFSRYRSAPKRKPCFITEQGEENQMEGIKHALSTRVFVVMKDLTVSGTRAVSRMVEYFGRLTGRGPGVLIATAAQMDGGGGEQVVDVAGKGWLFGGEGRPPGQEARAVYDLFHCEEKREDVLSNVILMVAQIVVRKPIVLEVQSKQQYALFHHGTVHVIYDALVKANLLKYFCSPNATLTDTELENRLVMVRDLTKGRIPEWENCSVDDWNSYIGKYGIFKLGKPGDPYSLETILLPCYDPGIAKYNGFLEPHYKRLYALTRALSRSLENLRLNPQDAHRVIGPLLESTKFRKLFDDAKEDFSWLSTVIWKARNATSHQRRRERRDSEEGSDGEDEERVIYPRPSAHHVRTVGAAHSAKRKEEYDRMRVRWSEMTPSEIGRDAYLIPLPDPVDGQPPVEPYSEAHKQFYLSIAKISVSVQFHIIGHRNKAEELAPTTRAAMAEKAIRHGFKSSAVGPQLAGDFTAVALMKKLVDRIVNPRSASDVTTYNLVHCFRCDLLFFADGNTTHFGSKLDNFAWDEKTELYSPSGLLRAINCSSFDFINRNDLQTVYKAVPVIDILQDDELSTILLDGLHDNGQLDELVFDDQPLGSLQTSMVPKDLLVGYCLVPVDASQEVQAVFARLHVLTFATSELQSERSELDRARLLFGHSNGTQRKCLLDCLAGTDDRERASRIEERRCAPGKKKPELGCDATFLNDPDRRTSHRQIAVLEQHRVAVEGSVRYCGLQFAAKEGRTDAVLNMNVNHTQHYVGHTSARSHYPGQPEPTHRVVRTLSNIFHLPRELRELMMVFQHCKDLGKYSLLLFGIKDVPPRASVGSANPKRDRKVSKSGRSRDSAASALLKSAHPMLAKFASPVEGQAISVNMVDAVGVYKTMGILAENGPEPGKVTRAQISEHVRRPARRNLLASMHWMIEAGFNVQEQERGPISKGPGAWTASIAKSLTSKAGTAAALSLAPSRKETTAASSTSASTSKQKGKTAKRAADPMSLAMPSTTSKHSKAITRAPRGQPSVPVSPAVGLRGMKNLGNTCFINTGVQCLHVTCQGHDDLTAYAIEEDKPEAEIAKLFQEALRQLPVPGQPLDIKDLRRKLESKYPKGQQDDAGDLALHLLSCLNEATGGKVIPSHQVLMSASAACKCEQPSVPKTEQAAFHSVPVPKDDGVLAVQQCLDRARAIESDEACSKCGSKISTTRKFMIAPSVLIVELARGLTPEGHKSNRPVEIQSDLDLTEHMVTSQGRVQYDLYAVAHHDGRSTEEGHWYASVLFDDEWLECDDTIVRRQAPFGVSGTASILMYRRRDASQTAPRKQALNASNGRADGQPAHDPLTTAEPSTSGDAQQGDKQARPVANSGSAQSRPAHGTASSRSVVAASGARSGAVSDGRLAVFKRGADTARHGDVRGPTLVSPPKVPGDPRISSRPRVPPRITPLRPAEAAALIDGLALTRGSDTDQHGKVHGPASMFEARFSILGSREPPRPQHVTPLDPQVADALRDRLATSERPADSTSHGNARRPPDPMASSKLPTSSSQSRPRVTPARLVAAQPATTGTSAPASHSGLRTTSGNTAAHTAPRQARKPATSRTTLQPVSEAKRVEAPFRADVPEMPNVTSTADALQSEQSELRVPSPPSAPSAPPAQVAPSPAVATSPPARARPSRAAPDVASQPTRPRLRHRSRINYAPQCDVDGNSLSDGEENGGSDGSAGPSACLPTTRSRSNMARKRRAMQEAAEMLPSPPGDLASAAERDSSAQPARKRVRTARAADPSRAGKRKERVDDGDEESSQHRAAKRTAPASTGVQAKETTSPPPRATAQPSVTPARGKIVFAAHKCEPALVKIFGRDQCIVDESGEVIGLHPSAEQKYGISLYTSNNLVAGQVAVVVAEYASDCSKILSAISLNLPIVSPRWLQAVVERGEAFMPSDDHLLQNSAEVAVSPQPDDEFNCLEALKAGITRRNESGQLLLIGRKVYLTQHVRSDAERVLKHPVRAAGAEFCGRHSLDDLQNTDLRQAIVVKSVSNRADNECDQLSASGLRVMDFPSLTRALMKQQLSGDETAGGA